MNMIYSASPEWGIGKDGALLYSIREDMKFFRETTKGKVVVMGRKTLESLPGGKPLKNRVNIVLTSREVDDESVITVHSVDELLKAVKQYDKESVFVIGGESLYKQLLPYCDTVYVTKVYLDADADTFAPNMDAQTDWYVANTGSRRTDENDVDYEIITYKREC